MENWLAVDSMASPFGELRIAATDQGVVRIGFVRGGTEFASWLARCLPDHKRTQELPALSQLRGELAEYFSGARTVFHVPLDLHGTPFQCQVWQGLREIPHGSTWTYRELAQRIGRPRALRAVGAANGANPIPIVVPCHRVVAAGGKLGGFSSGLDVKRKLLAHESQLPLCAPQSRAARSLALVRPPPLALRSGSSGVPELCTERLRLREWKERDLAPFAALNRDPEVMQFLPAPLTRADSDALAAQIRGHFRETGFGLWAVEIPGRCEFAGFVGLSRARFPAHFTPCIEIGWRLARACWGAGYASEAAREVLRFAFETLALPEVVSFTTTANVRSRAVMERIGMTRDPGDDFDHPRLPVGNALRRHVLYRLRAPSA